MINTIAVVEACCDLRDLVKIHRKKLLPIFLASPENNNECEGNLPSPTASVPVPYSCSETCEREHGTGFRFHLNIRPRDFGIKYQKMPKKKEFW